MKKPSRGFLAHEMISGNNGARKRQSSHIFSDGTVRYTNKAEDTDEMLVPDPMCDPFSGRYIRFIKSGRSGGWYSYPAGRPQLDILRYVRRELREIPKH